MVENLATAGRAERPNVVLVVRAMEEARRVRGAQAGSRRDLVATRTLRLIVDIVFLSEWRCIRTSRFLPIVQQKFLSSLFVWKMFLLTGRELQGQGKLKPLPNSTELFPHMLEAECALKLEAVASPVSSNRRSFS